MLVYAGMLDREVMVLVGQQARLKEAKIRGWRGWTEVRQGGLIRGLFQNFPSISLLV
jgi:hypothetical protein